MGTIADVDAIPSIISFLYLDDNRCPPHRMNYSRSRISALNFLAGSMCTNSVLTLELLNDSLARKS